METLKEAFLESTIVQGLLACTLTGTICYMYIQTGDAPESLVGLLGLILGFYFRTKAGVQVRKELAQD